MLLLTLVALAAKGREARASQFLVILFAVYAGLYAARNIPVSSLLLILVIGPWLSGTMENLKAGFTTRRAALGWPVPASVPFLDRMSRIELSLRGHLWPIAAIVLTYWIAAHGGKLGTTPLMDAHFDAKRFPAAAVNYLEKQNVQGSLLTPDYWGGFLIYRSYPRIRVVIDDRHDFYGEDFLKSYLKMVHVEPEWREFIQKYRPARVVVPRASALANILFETSDWQAVYRDEVAIVFQHKELE